MSTDNVGFRSGESIWLGSGSRLLARGVALVYPDAVGVRRGDVLDGGTIAITAHKGYVVAQTGAVIDVSGASATVDLAQSRGAGFTYVATGIPSDAGSISIATREGALLDATLAAHAGGAGASGGTFGLTVGFGVETPPDLFPPTYPTGERIVSVRQSGSALPAGLKPGDAIDLSLNGLGLITADALMSGGLDRVSLAAANRIAFVGDVHLSAQQEIALSAPVISASGASQVRLDTAYAQLGNPDPRFQFEASVPPQAPTGGPAGLSVHALNIDVEGNSVLQGFALTTLTSAGNVRLIGVLDDSPDARVLTGSLSTGGDLRLDAAQVYPTTLSQFTLASTGDITIRGNGAAVRTPLSAGGQLTLVASDIMLEPQAIVRAPFGQLDLEASGTITVAPGALLSASADGAVIPFGTLQNGIDWVYDLGDGKIVTIAAPPEKRIRLSAASVDLQSGSRIDLSGGGDLYAFEFTPGPGGSRDGPGRHHRR